MKISELIEAAKDFLDLKKSQEKAYNTFLQINSYIDYAIKLKANYINITAPVEWNKQIKTIEKLINRFATTIDNLINGNRDDVLKAPIIEDLTSYKNMLYSKKQKLDQQ
jgi:hypothetical protein